MPGSVPLVGSILAVIGEIGLIMTEPAEWLLARIAEEEEAYWLSMQTAGDFTTDTGPVHPARLIRNCEGMRRVVNLHRAVGDPRICLSCGHAFPWPCPTLVALSVAFDWHGEYDEVWQPLRG